MEKAIRFTRNRTSRVITTLLFLLILFLFSKLLSDREIVSIASKTGHKFFFRQERNPEAGFWSFDIIFIHISPEGKMYRDFYKHTEFPKLPWCFRLELKEKERTLAIYEGREITLYNWDTREWLLIPSALYSQYQKAAKNGTYYEPTP